MSILCSTLLICLGYDDQPEMESLSEVIAAYRESVEAAGTDSAHIEDDSTAIGVEWVSMRDIVSEGRIKRNGDHFLGYLSGRLRVTPPKWWSRKLQDGFVVTKSDDPRIAKYAVNFGGDNHLLDLWNENDQGWMFSGFTGVSVIPEGLLLKHEEHEIILSKEDFADLSDESGDWKTTDGKVAGAMLDGICVVSFECDCPSGPYSLYCVDIKTGNPLWVEELRTSMLPNTGIGGDPGGCYTQIVLDKNRVFLWTANGMSLVLEIFDKRDGKRLASFVTSYLNGVRLKGSEK